MPIKVAVSSRTLFLWFLYVNTSTNITFEVVNSVVDALTLNDIAIDSTILDSIIQQYQIYYLLQLL